MKMNSDPNWLKAKAAQEDGCEVGAGHSDPSICRMSGKVHSPAIVSRCGGPTAEELNICGICGSDLTMVRGVWIAISDEQAYAIRGRKS